MSVDLLGVSANAHVDSPHDCLQYWFDGTWPTSMQNEKEYSGEYT